MLVDAEEDNPKLSKQHNQPGRALISLDCPYNEWPAGTLRSPPPEPALLFSRDAHRHTPEVAADGVAQTCERLLTLSEPGLRPTWGLDAENPPAADAHEGTEEQIRNAHRDRHTVDCGNSGMSPDFDILQSLVGDASPLESNGSDSDQPADAPSEPAPPPHPAAMGNASPVRGLGGADDSAMAEGVEPAGVPTGLDEGVASGSGGAVVAPADGLAKPEHEVGQFLHGLDTVCVPAAPLRKNSPIRRKLVPANVAACIIGATATRICTKTAYVTPRHVAYEQGKSTSMCAADCSPGMLAAVKCARPDAEQTAQAMVTPCEAVKTAGGEPWRVAAARKKAAAYSDEPSLKEAMNGIHRDKWLEAMQDELASLSENGVYELVSLPMGAAALSGKWDLKIKRGAQGEIERFKARYVVRGFEQVLGKDFHETWAPVGHYTTLRCLLVIYVQEGLETVHLDIKCAFQNGKLTDLVYVSQPEELGDGSGKVRRLRKALYGLKQAAREWHKVLAEVRDLVRCHNDPALYVRKYGRCIIFIWVDDLLIFTKPDVMKPLCDRILARFKGRS